jgi:hypothetical protein
VAVNPPSQAQQEVTQPGFASGGPVIPYEQTSIPGLGKNLGTDSWAYGEKDNGTLVDVTPTAGAPMYNFPWPNASAYALSITANNVNLDDPSIPTPTFCVGQGISFDVSWGLCPPPYTNVVAHWTLPGTFVNTKPYPYCPAFYNENAAFLNRILSVDKILSTSCWYVDKLDAGTASVGMNLYFDNGQVVFIQASGQLAIVKPSIENLTTNLSPQFSTNGSGTETMFCGAGFNAWVRPPDGFSGTASFTQLVNTSYYYYWPGLNYGIFREFHGYQSGGI